jgi:hypothetical protein
MVDNTTLSSTTTRLLARRRWLKGTGALLGLALLAAPAQTLALAPLAAGPELIGTVRLLSGTVVPEGWMRCDGRVLPVADHPALFAVLGAVYGGNGTHTFALPHLGEPALTGAGAVAMQFAIKTANGPATTTTLAELRLVHQRRPRASMA